MVLSCCWTGEELCYSGTEDRWVESVIVRALGYGVQSSMLD